MMYLSVFIARSGFCSRRKAAEVVKAGEVTVNTVIITDPSYEVNEQTDKVAVLEQILKLADPVYIVLNKPKNVVTTCDDEKKRRTVADLVKYKHLRLFPVGRLDKETTGVLLMTNDGDFSHKLAHPKYNIKKNYIVKLNKPFTQTAHYALKRGIYLHDGGFRPDRIYYPVPKNKWVIGLEIHSGKYRIIRRALYKLGFEVVELDRISFGSISAKGLQPGEWKLLKRQQVLNLLPQSD